MEKSDLKKITTQQKTLLTIGVIAIASIACHIFILQPSYAEIKTMKIAIDEKHNEIQLKLTQSMTTAMLLEDIKNVEGKIDKLNGMYVAQNRELELITYLEGLAAENGITQNININQAEINNQYFSRISLQVKASGQYFDVLRYLKDMEKSKYQINILKIDLQNSGDSATLNYVAEAYVLKSQ